MGKKLLRSISLRSTCVTKTQSKKLKQGNTTRAKDQKRKNYVSLSEFINSNKISKKISQFWTVFKAGADLGGGGGRGGRTPPLRDSTPCRPKGSPL